MIRTGSLLSICLLLAGNAPAAAICDAVYCHNVDVAELQLKTVRELRADYCVTKRQKEDADEDHARNVACGTRTCEEWALECTEEALRCEALAARIRLVLRAKKHPETPECYGLLKTEGGR